MFKTFAKATAIAAVAIMSPTAAAQDLLAGKPIYPLGEPMTWSNGDASYTFVADDLAKLVATPQNTANVFLYPENGAINTPENQQKGAQPFYVDMQSDQQVGSVTTTWEGAAANSYNIYLTETEPTAETLQATPTYTATGLGQYSLNSAVLPDGSHGRYLVFQVTDATNWGWGVKIRSIAAAAPAEDELTGFTVAPSFATIGTPTPVSMTFTNQLGTAIAAEKVSVSVSDNATFADGVLTINSGDAALFTASMGDVELTATVYAVSAPAVPASEQILTPIFTNGKTEYNGTAGFIVAYNGGAKELGRITFPDGEVAAGFADTRCVFFYNNSAEIMGGWDVDINPTEKNYGALHIDIFATKNVSGNVVFERTTAIGDNHPITLKAGEWNSIEIPLAGETMLHTMSVRFDDANVSDILVSNIYFSPLVDSDDEDAPVFGEISADASMTGVTLSFSATDTASRIYYTISDGTRSFVTNAVSGENVTYTVSGLAPDTDYTFTITASDGKNKAVETIQAKTLPFVIPAADTPVQPADKVRAIYCAAYGVTPEGVWFDNWGSQARGEKLKDASGNDLFYLTNYANNQWGGICGFEVEPGTGKYLHVDIYGDAAPGNITIYPVWKAVTEGGASIEGTHITKEIQPEQWNYIDIPLSEFGYPDNGGLIVFQVAFTNSSLSNFAVNNLYFWSDDVITGVEAVAADGSAPVDVYTLQGIKVRAGVAAAAALDGLPGGVYIVGGIKVAK